MNEYRMRPESEQTAVTLLEIPEKWMTLRALSRTTGRKAHYSSTQFGAVNIQPKAPKDKNKNDKGPAAIADKYQEKGDKYGDGSGGADSKAKGNGGNGGNKGGKKGGGKIRKNQANVAWEEEAWQAPAWEAPAAGNGTARTRSTSAKRKERTQRAKDKWAAAAADPVWAEGGWDQTAWGTGGQEWAAAAKGDEKNGKGKNGKEKDKEKM